MLAFFLTAVEFLGRGGGQVGEKQLEVMKEGFIFFSPVGFCYVWFCVTASANPHHPLRDLYLFLGLSQILWQA